MAPRTSLRRLQRICTEAKALELFPNAPLPPPPAPPPPPALRRRRENLLVCTQGMGRSKGGEVGVPCQKGRSGGGGGGSQRAWASDRSLLATRHRDVRQLQQAGATRQQHSQALPRTSPLRFSANQKPADASLDPERKRGNS